MKIDGREAASGSIIVAPGQTGELTLPWGNVELVFKPDVAPMNIAVAPPGNQIVFEGTDNPVGVAYASTLTFGEQRQLRLSIMVYAVGSGSDVTRLVHYTVS